MADIDLRHSHRTQAQALRARGGGAALAGAVRRDIARPEVADREPVDRNLRRQPHRRARGDCHACGGRTGGAAPGRRRLRARPSDARLRLDQPRHRQQDLARPSTCSKCAWASRSKAPALRHSGATARRRPRSRRPSSNSNGCSARPADRQDRFRLPPRDRGGDQQSLLCRGAGCAGRPDHPLRSHLALGHGERADARIPGRAAARTSASSSMRFPPAIRRPRAMRCASISPPARNATARACAASRRNILPASAQPRTAALTSERLEGMHDHIDYTSRYAIDPEAAAAMAHGRTAPPFPSSPIFSSRARISLTYTHYDRMIVGGAMPASGALGAGGDQADGNQKLSRPPRTDRRQCRRAGNRDRRRRGPMISARAT